EDPFPPIYERAQFVLAPDERCQSMRRRGRFEPPSYTTRSNYAVESNRPLDALERLRSAIFYYEQPGDQPMGVRGYQYGAGIGYGLHARGDIGGVAEYVGLPARTRADHHRT